MKEEWDLIVLGSGAAGLAAAASAAEFGLAVLLIERDAWIGGTSAMSGAAIWIPGTRQALAAGLAGDVERARGYLKRVLGDAYREDLVDAFLARGGEALAFLEDRAGLDYSLRALGPDYYPEVEGATERGRILDVAEFDGARLGPWLKRLRRPLRGFVLFGGMMLDRTDAWHLMRFRRSPRSFLHAARRVAKYGLDRLRHGRGARLTLGAALVGRLLAGALAKGVRVETEVEALELIAEGGRVVGVRARRRGQEVDLRARGGLVLATGGMGRAPWAPGERPDTSEDHVSFAAPLSDGAGIEMGKAVGAAYGGEMRGGFHWAPASVDQGRGRADEPYPHIVTDRAKPGVIAVNAEGERFTNEANSYHRFVGAMREEIRQGRTRFHLICDDRALKAYGLGLARPAPGNNEALVRSGYLVRARSLEGLAARIGLDHAALARTVAEHNGFAAAGADARFGKGSTVYNRALGDPEAAHPNLAPIDRPPFYAVRLRTGDLGPARGLVTDADARVLGPGGAPIPGLYAVGNDMNSVMAGDYPGPGITLGPALVFAYLAARSAAAELSARTQAAGAP